jgi:hypothetical protein
VGDLAVGTSLVGGTVPVPNDIVIRQLDLELHGSCNYKCEMCPQAEGREAQFLTKLPYELFTKIIDDATQYGLESVSLHGSGEPTLHPRMSDMARYVKERDLHCVSFTNGLRLDEALARELIATGIDVLRISCIGYDRPSYKRWMSRDAYERVRENVRRFVELNEELGGRTQVHMYHLVTDVDRRDEEIAAYQENWAAYTGAMAEVWLMHNWSGTYEEGVPYHRLQIRRRAEQRSCGRPFSPTLEVRAGGLDGHKGAVVACCMVLGRDSEAVLGHLDTQTIAEVVSGAAYEELRSAHSEGRFSDISYCDGCDQLYDVPESLVWSNIPGRAYGVSKIVDGLDHRSFAETVR